MKKRFVSVMLGAVMTAALLSGCGSKKAETEAPATEAATEAPATEAATEAAATEAATEAGVETEAEEKTTTAEEGKFVVGFDAE